MDDIDKMSLISSVHKPTDGVYDDMEMDEKEFIDNVAELVLIHMKESPYKAVNFVNEQMLDVDETIALWTRLPSNIRAAFKKAQKGLI